MRNKLIISSLLASVALSSAYAQQSPAPAPAAPAPAQSPAPAAPAPATAPAQRIETTTKTTQAPIATTAQWRASKLVGVDVYNNANEKIGDISEVLLDASGKVTGVIIGVGGFLGMGQHDVLVQLADLKFVNEPVARTATTTTTTNTTTGTAATTTTRPARDANEKWYPDHAVMNATKDQLKGMPAFKYN